MTMTFLPMFLSFSLFVCLSWMDRFAPSGRDHLVAANPRDDAYPVAQFRDGHVANRRLVGADEADQGGRSGQLARRPDARANLAVDPEAFDFVGLEAEDGRIERLSCGALGRQVDRRGAGTARKLRRLGLEQRVELGTVHRGDAVGLVHDDGDVVAVGVSGGASVPGPGERRDADSNEQSSSVHVQAPPQNEYATWEMTAVASLAIALLSGITRLISSLSVTNGEGFTFRPPRYWVLLRVGTDVDGTT